MKLLYGKPIADEILSRLKGDISSSDFMAGLAVILVGDDPASHIYVNLKEKAAKDAGIMFSKYVFSSDTKQEEVLQAIEFLNNDPESNGIIVQLPLPPGFDTKKIISSINTEKDADGFHPENIKLFLSATAEVRPVFPYAISLLLNSSGEILAGKRAVVLANSEEFGEIMNEMLRRNNLVSQYVLVENFVAGLSDIKEADVVISAVGLPGLLKVEMLRDGAIVIDGGISKQGGVIRGDFDASGSENIRGFYSPVPGGVGPVTIACLLENVYLASLKQRSFSEKKHI